MKRLLRWLGYVLGTVLVVVGGLVGFMWFKGGSMLAQTFSPPAEQLTVTSDSATIARGRHMATAISKCVDCHTADLGGGPVIPDSPLGRVTAANLTTGQGGVLGQLTDAQLERAIRHGVKHDGTSALIMPVDAYQYITDADVAAIIAFIRAQPPVDRTLAPTSLKLLGRALLVAGQLPMSVNEADTAIAHVASIVEDSTVTYGKYMANAGGCTGCHGPGLSGGKIPGAPPEAPPAANLTPTGIGHYNDAQLEAILRTGTRPDGSKLNDFMPWRATALMTPNEMAVTIKYLRAAQPKVFGGR